MTRILQLLGKKIGRLLVIERAPNNKHGQTQWKCLCDCGSVITTSGNSLSRNHAHSCGCYRLDQLRKKIVKHGNSPRAGKTPTYRAWKAMRDRCLSNGQYARNYAERGISVCERWAQSFENFLADMGDRPNGTTLDRIENDIGYQLNNCRWVTRKEQTRNRRNTLGTIHNGEWISIGEFAERYIMSYVSALSRISANGKCIRLCDAGRKTWERNFGTEAELLAQTKRETGIEQQETEVA